MVLWGRPLERYENTVHEFVLARMTQMGVPVTIIPWVARFLRGWNSIPVGNAVVRERFILEAGIRHGEALSALLFVLASTFLFRRT